MRTEVGYLRSTFGLSERRACELMEIAVSSYRYWSRRQGDGELREKLVALAGEKPRFGYRRLHVLLKRSGEGVNHKRVWRVYREAGLCVKRKKRKRLVRRGLTTQMLSRANQEWALDFVHDVLGTGQRVRVLSVLDAYTREGLALEVDTSFASRRVTRVLERLIAERGQPESLRCDNGPELTSRHFLAWCVERKIQLVHIEPGRPMQNGVIVN
jgi:putative transposase